MGEDFKEGNLVFESLPVLPHLLPHLFILQLLVLEPGQLSRQPFLLLQLLLPLLLLLFVLTGANSSRHNSHLEDDKLQNRAAEGLYTPSGRSAKVTSGDERLPPAPAPRRGPHPPHGLVQPPLPLHRSPQPGRPPPPAALLCRRRRLRTRERRCRRAALTDPAGPPCRSPPAARPQSPLTIPPAGPARAAMATGGTGLTFRRQGPGRGKMVAGMASRRAPGATPLRVLHKTAFCFTHL